MSADQRVFLYFLAWAAIGVGLIVLIARRWPADWERFQARTSITVVAMLAIVWPAALLWLVILEATGRRGNRPDSGLIGQGRSAPTGHRAAPMPPVASLFSAKALLSGAATLTLGLLMMRQWPTLTSLRQGIFLPVGGLLVGGVIGVGYGAGTRQRVAVRTLPFALVSGGLSVAALLADRLLTCQTLRAPFMACYSELMTGTRVLFERSSFTTGELGAIGYLNEVLTALGLALGAAATVYLVHSWGDRAPSQGAA